MDFFRGYRNFHGFLKGLHIASWISSGHIYIYIFFTVPMEFLRGHGMDFFRGHRNFHGFLKGLHIASWISSGLVHCFSDFLRGHCSVEFLGGYSSLTGFLQGPQPNKGMSSIGGGAPLSEPLSKHG